MGKRKQKVPSKSDAEKRQCASWSMYDNVKPTPTSNQPSTSSMVQQVQTGRRDCDTSSLDDQSQTVSKNTVQLDDAVKRRKQSEFQEHLDNCDFCLTIRNNLELKNGSWHCKLGTFIVNVLGSPLECFTSFPGSKSFWLYVSSVPGASVLYFDLDVQQISSKGKKKKNAIASNFDYYLVTLDMPYEALSSLQPKCIQVVCSGYSSSTRELHLSIYLLESAIFKLKFHSEAPRKTNLPIMHLMKFLFNIDSPALIPNEGMVLKHDLDSLYGAIKEIHAQQSPTVHINVQHPSLKPSLRQYQKDAVQWMLQKERFSESLDGQAECLEPSLHTLYQEITTEDAKLLYYNKFAGILARNKPLTTQSPPGGILADEMGLGKTVEVLACMLTNQRTDLPFPEMKPPNSDVVIHPTAMPKLPAVKMNSLVKKLKKTNRKKREATVAEADNQGKDSLVENGTSDNEVLDGVSKSKDCDTNEQDVEMHAGTCSHEPAGFSLRNIGNPESCSVENGKPENVDNCSHVVETITGSHLIEDGAQMEKDFLLPSVPLGASEASRVSSDNNMCETEQESVDRKNEEINLVETDVGNRSNTIGLEPDTSSSPVDSDAHHISVVSTNGNVSPKSQTTDMKLKLLGVTDQRLNPTFVEGTKDKQSKFGVGTQRNYFECICGVKDYEYDDKIRVKCEKCGLLQHPDCVHYNLDDPFRGAYKCPHCHAIEPPIQSAATLIISPQSICHQWTEEIKKHVKSQSIKVFVYTGVHKQGFIQPQTLANHDIVVTTYETLSSEINYVDLPHSNSEAGRRFRHPKRFMAIPSPIIAVEWWRICLDEAQMVECTTTKTAEMALRLSAVNRWCVTGTPIQRGIEDIYGLLLFLGVDPFWVHSWWKLCVHNPFCRGDVKPLHSVLSSVLWRTSKEDVIDQIQLPAQNEKIYWLSFSPVEEHFYRRQFQDCCQEATRKLKNWTESSHQKLSNLDRYSMNSLLHPLLRLRQACCHPQAVRGQFVPIHKSTLTMEELLDSLTKKATVECEEAHRQVVAALNGLGAVYIIKQQFVDAAEMYREVLASVDKHKDQLRTDDLQQLHALHNLKEVITAHPGVIPPTLRDDRLTQQAHQLKEKYMAKVAVRVSDCQNSLHQAQKICRQFKHELHDHTDWWLGLLQDVCDHEHETELIERIKDELASTATQGHSSIAYRFRDTRGLQLIIHEHLTNLQSFHSELLMTVRKLSGTLSQDTINKTVECCLRPISGGIQNNCPFCLCHKVFEEYESRLFHFSDRVSNDGEKHQGTWADSEVEKALKIVHAYARFMVTDRSWLEYGQVHFKLLDSLKKEFKGLRALWMALRDQVSAIDELDMATMRLRLRLPEEPKLDPPVPYIIDECELEQTNLKQLSDKVIGESELKKRLGQLVYLKNLAKSQEEIQDGNNPEPCPICQRQLGVKWSVLQCGHCYCLECIRVLVDTYGHGAHGRRQVKCAMCREKTHQGSISYVSTKPNVIPNLGDEGIQVKGSHSTKVEAVVRCLKKIHESEPGAKALVFSTWSDVLDVIARALQENNIPYRSLHTPNKFQVNLSSFRQNENIMALLLPIHSGANGLNLTEATHVLLVEPILNPGQELQAVGRVHRIGQTRKTTVHHFLVRYTIEEKIHSMLRSISAHTSTVEENTMTIGDLASLFSDTVADGAMEDNGHETHNFPDVQSLNEEFRQ